MHVLHVVAFLAAGAPNPAPAAPPGLDTFANTVLGWIKWVGLIGGVAGLMGAGIQMTLGHRHRSQLAADGATHIPWVLAGLTTISLAAGITGAVLT